MIATRDIDEHLALNVMGWVVEEGNSLLRSRYYDPKKYNHNLASDEQSCEMAVSDWQPSFKVEHTFLLVPKMQMVGFQYSTDNYPLCRATARSLNQLIGRSNAEGETAAEAISRAIAYATGWKE